MAAIPFLIGCFMSSGGTGSLAARTGFAGGLDAKAHLFDGGIKPHFSLMLTDVDIDQRR